MSSDVPADAHRGGELRIGVFRVEPKLHRISGPGGPRTIRPREMQVLLCLASHAPQPLSSQRLLAAVWRDQAVADSVVANTIYEVRKALREAAGDADAEIIETVPGGGGYRLVAPTTVGARRPLVAALLLV